MTVAGWPCGVGACHIGGAGRPSWATKLYPAAGTVPSTGVSKALVVAFCLDDTSPSWEEIHPRESLPPIPFSCPGHQGPGQISKHMTCLRGDFRT